MHCPAAWQPRKSRPPAHTRSGIELGEGGYTLRVDALRADVLRVRFWPLGHPAEDASWAVLPEARTARVAVTSEANGFSTTELRVAVGADLRLTVSDLNGNVLQSDALPLAWNTDGFKVTKSRTAEDHYFGLGDKPGAAGPRRRSLHHVEHGQLRLAGVN